MVLAKLFIPIERQFVQMGFMFTLWGRKDEMKNSLQEIEKAKEQTQWQTLKKENENLKEQLHFLDTHPYTYISASVLARSPDPFQATFLIDRGSFDGIQIGDPVVVSEGVLIGKILDVWPHQSSVRALVDRQSKTAATLLPLVETIGSVEGDLGGFLRFRLIPQQVSLAIGDIVMTSGLESSIVSHLLIGKIHAIEKEPQNTFQEAIIEPFADYRLYTLVYILTRSALENL
jgi:rod shape-determining protein MreC